MARDPEDVIREFIDTFVDAWPRKDAAALSRFFSDDAVYYNGPLEPLTGRESIVTSIETFMDMYDGDIGVDILHLVAEGPIVLTERVDHVYQAGGKLSMPIAGVFEVHDGQITAWRDYFDLNQWLEGLSHG